MYEKFCDYMYYLLTSPFKRIKKSVNQWYILFRVLGNRFDDAMESIYKAQEQTMIATCDPLFLQIHADERKMKRYAGEEDENFRKRIANCAEVLRLGGSDEGVLLAIKTLGYNNPEIVKANVYTGRCKYDESGQLYIADESKEDRWAEFYVLIQMSVDERHPISTEILKKEVRKQKYVGAKDNYCFEYQCVTHFLTHQMIMSEHRMTLSFWDYFKMDGSWVMDGTYMMNSEIREYSIGCCCTFKIVSTEKIGRLSRHLEHNLFYMDGSWIMDGSKILDAYVEDTEEIEMKSVTSKIRRKKMADASRYGNALAKAKWIALGSGGVDEDGQVKAPLEEDVSLRNELIRKEYSSVRQESETEYEYDIHLGELELVGEYISEIALIDEDGDVMVSAAFLPQGKDETETTYKIVDSY